MLVSMADIYLYRVLCICRTLRKRQRAQINGDLYFAETDIYSRYQTLRKLKSLLINIE